MKLEPVVRKTGGGIDDRFHAADYARRAIRKAFPDQWSFFLGEVALYSFIILILTGIFLTLFFVPSLHEVVYHGSYTTLDGVHMSEAYRSVLHITFDVRGGLLVRQIHHWAADVFLGAIALHALRIFFTGAFRKPREVNWIIGITMFVLAALEGFLGYSMPGDMLSGTGVRIAEGITLSIPLVGSYLSFFLFGGQYPGTVFDTRFYIAHVLLLPGLILALVAAHIMILWHQGHTQFPGKREKEHVEVGAQMFPVFVLKTTSLFFFVFGALALLGAVAQINPVWLFGPYHPLNVSDGSQPDWYIGFLEGSLRLMPGVISNIGGHTFAWNVFIPAVLLPLVFFALMYAYPFVERWVTGDNRPHNVLDRPRNTPTRTALGVAVITSAAVLQIAAGDDVISANLGMAVEDLVWTLRAGFFIFPVVAFLITRRICIALQRADRRRLRAGRPFGIISQSADGAAGTNGDGTRGYAPVARPMSEEEQARMAAHRPDELIRPIPRHLVPLPTPHRVLEQVRARVNHYYMVSWLEPPYQDGGPPESKED